ncbi:MAG TPA: Mov34/MPN/PAD-1 family protein [Gemmataceae bacterium]|nr:Mov34/MPN/PAD-1 family protein [Gemmataceae bacterium]
MFQGLVSTANRLYGTLQRTFLRGRPALVEAPQLPALPRSFKRLERVVLTAEVSRTLFEEYAAHRASQRGEEEIGWVLLGVREVDHAIVLATLPAGAQRSAGVAHVQFNKNAQALASRIVRQWDKRLVMLGIVHTHPGNLRHPSDGDFHGDSAWVGQLRGGDGIFAIGTAEAVSDHGGPPHVQTMNGLTLCWYGLKQGDDNYRPLPVEVTKGVDLALPLHPVWETIEAFANPLERLCVQQAGMTFQVVGDAAGSALVVCLKLAEPGAALRIVLKDRQAAWYWQRGEELHGISPSCEQLDRNVYLLLADLAAGGKDH